MDVEVILLWRLPENSIERQINVMREKFQDRREVLFCCEMWLTGGGFLLVEGVFGFDGWLFLGFGEREVESGLVELGCGEGFCEFLNLVFEL
jgi:hypothetical protein